jgi:hypothetical protein
VRKFFQPAQSNFGKSEAISYVNPSKFRPGGQQQFSYSQTPNPTISAGSERCPRCVRTTANQRIWFCGRPARAVRAAERDGAAAAAAGRCRPRGG